MQSTFVATVHLPTANLRVRTKEIVDTYFVGLELVADHCALSVIRRDVRFGKVVYSLTSCARLKNHYDRLAAFVDSRLAWIRTNGQMALIVNSTIIGRPIKEHLRREFDVRGVKVIHFVSIVPGNKEDLNSDPLQVPILDLVGAIQIMSQTSGLVVDDHINADNADANTLSEALREVSLNLSDLESRSPRVWGNGELGDYVISIGLACWAADRLDLFTL